MLHEQMKGFCLLYLFVSRLQVRH
uniref:Uncharacterized protein n=1 Tax=Oryza nivara TaxID=4536 RepID=A0A0E0GDZ1_ORYNI